MPAPIRISCVRGFDEYGCQAGFMSAPEVMQLIPMPPFVPATKPVFLHDYRDRGGFVNNVAFTLRWDSFASEGDALDAVRNSGLAYIGALCNSPLSAFTRPWQMFWANITRGSASSVGSLVQPLDTLAWLALADPTKPFDAQAISPSPLSVHYRGLPRPPVRGAPVSRTYNTVAFSSSPAVEAFAVKRNALVTQVDDRFPHVCPRCGGRAYVGLAMVECARACSAG